MVASGISSILGRKPRSSSRNPLPANADAYLKHRSIQNIHGQVVRISQLHPEKFHAAPNTAYKEHGQYQQTSFHFFLLP